MKSFQKNAKVIDAIFDDQAPERIFRLNKHRGPSEVDRIKSFDGIIIKKSNRLSNNFESLQDSKGSIAHYIEIMAKNTRN